MQMQDRLQQIFYHVLVEKLENSAPNTAARIILSADGAKRNSDKQYDFMCG
jgi:predicted TPR repeat methyltransferase